MFKEAIAFWFLEVHLQARFEAPLSRPRAVERGVLQLRESRHADMRLLSFVLAALLLSNAPAAGQDPSLPNAASACTYDACALRLEQRRLLRGVQSQPVFTLRLWGAPRLRPHVASSDSALAYAAEFDRHYTAGTRFGLLGLLGAAVAGALYTNSEGAADLSDREVIVQLGVVAVSLGLTLYGGRRVNRAMRDLSRAIWWYNRELPR